jgi:hypothetical protein
LSSEQWKTNITKVLPIKVFLDRKETSKNESKFNSKLEIFESRYTKKPMTLNVTIEQHYCETNQKAVILFNFSPKEFEHDTWVKLAEVTLRKDLCK